MQACAHCGHQSPASAVVCAACARPLQHVRPGMNQTMMGMPAPQLGTPNQGSPPNPGNGPRVPRPEGPSARSSKPPAAGFDPKRTLLGGVSTNVAASAAASNTGSSPRPAQPEGAPRITPVAGTPAHTLSPTQSSVLHPGAEGASVGSTLLGMTAPPFLPVDGATQTLGAPGNPAHTGPALGSGQTLLGMPTPLGTEQPPASVGVLAPVAAPPPSTGPGGTLLGVAAPASAPARDVAPPPATEALPGPAIRSSTVPLELERPEHSQALEFGSRQRRSGWLLLGVAATLLCGVLVFLFSWKVPEPLHARVGSDGRGGDRLELSCEDCPAGSTVSYAGKRASFDGSSAFIELDRPFTIGTHELELTLERPGIGRDEEVSVTVPVRSRAFTDLSGLLAPEPRLTVKVQAEADTKVVLAGAPRELTNGEATYDLPLQAAITGESEHLQTFGETVEYQLSAPSGETHQGALRVELPIVPLVLLAPSPSWLTAEPSVVLVGKTAPGASVQIGQSVVAIDATGRFEHTVHFGEAGTVSVTVRASAPGHAPRIVRRALERTTDLGEAAKAWRSKARSSYPDVLNAAQTQSVSPVVLSGWVQESRVSEQSTIFVLDVRTGCPARPCLARVLASQALSLAAGSRVEVFGTTRSVVDNPLGGAPLPEIEAAFISK